MIITEIIPVIHKLSDEQVKINVELCLECGIKKVFLIDHTSTEPEKLITTAYSIKNQYDIWVGINMLSLSTPMALHMDLAIDGLWCDATITPELAQENRQFKGQFFGGLAFKYQPQPTYLKEACDAAISATDVATTSGSGTGKPATLHKIQMLRYYLGLHPMAIASGVSIDNVQSYKGLVDYLLVASSITDMKTELIDKTKLINLIAALNT